MKALKKKIFFGTIGCFCLVYISCNRENTHDKKRHPNHDSSIMVFAAASLFEVISEISDSFKQENNIKLKFNFASSGSLARLTEQGEIPDVFISANESWMNYIDSLGYIKNNLKQTLAMNELVLVSPLNSNQNMVTIDRSLDFLSLAGDKRISMGDPEHVPAGRYALQALQYFNQHEKLMNKILPAKDVRSALLMVEMQESNLGIVYKTDALKSSKVKITGFFPDQSHDTIKYVAALLKESPNAQDFFNYLYSNKAKSIWTKYGFKNEWNAK